MPRADILHGGISDIGQARPRRAAWLNPALLCLILGLLGVLPLVVLTPPFQVPDESQHFVRAYQFSELRVRSIVQDGEARALVPASVIGLIETFLGTRESHSYWSPVAPEEPWRRTWSALDRPLDPGRRELMILPLSVYPPPPYLPQAIAIAGGRWLGAGPLMLLYLARLANALVAVVVLAWAVQLMPIGRAAAMFLGLLPMAIYEYASVAPDAAIITTAFLFTAIALRAQLRAQWKIGEVALAIASGLVFCPIKPVYAPLLLIALPAALVRARVKHTLLVHAAIILIVLGVTAAWLHFAAPMRSLPPGSSASGQIAFMTAHPLVYLRAIVVKFWDSHFYYKSSVGVLGWDTVVLPGVAYVIPVFGLLLGTLAQPREGPRLPAVVLAWHSLLLVAAVALIITSQYLLWTRVGSSTVEGVQGRYFLPLLALIAAGWCSVVKAPRLRAGLLAVLLLVIAAIVAEYVITDVTIVEAYHVF